MYEVYKGNKFEGHTILIGKSQEKLAMDLVTSNKKCNANLFMGEKNMFLRKDIVVKPVVDVSKKYLFRFFVNETNQSLKMKWIKKALPQRVMIEGHNDFLESYRNNLEKEGIPSMYIPLPNGKKAIEVWYNQITFVKKLDDVAEKTIKATKTDFKLSK